MNTATTFSFEYGIDHKKCKSREEHILFPLDVCKYLVLAREKVIENYASFNFHFTDVQHFTSPRGNIQI